jgi:hypothetical protein
MKKGGSSDNDDDDEDDDEDEYSTGKGTRRRGGPLPQGKINIVKLADLNGTERKEGAIIRSVDFNRTSQVALVAGNSGVVSFYQVYVCRDFI